MLFVKSCNIPSSADGSRFCESSSPGTSKSSVETIDRYHDSVGIYRRSLFPVNDISERPNHGQSSVFDSHWSTFPSHSTTGRAETYKSIMTAKLDPTPISRALIFDLVGTCTDWRSSVVAALQRQCSCIPVPLPNLRSEEDLVRFASDWRTGFFREIHQRFESGDPQEDIDLTHRRVLDQLLSRKETLVALDVWGDGIRSDLVQSWHHQDGITMVPSYDF